MTFLYESETHAHLFDRAMSIGNEQETKGEISTSSRMWSLYNYIVVIIYIINFSIVECFMLCPRFHFLKKKTKCSTGIVILTAFAVPSALIGFLELEVYHDLRNTMTYIIP